MMQKFFICFVAIIIAGCNSSAPVNIYETEELKSLSRKDIIIGESVWGTTCFRCHTNGSNGAQALNNSTYWDSVAHKGFDKLYNSVLMGKEGKEGVMPPKGLCNTCSEHELKTSVYYLFSLAKKVQEAEKSQN